MNEWISVKNEIPCEGEHVIVYCNSKNGKIYTMVEVLNSGTFWDYSIDRSRDVTHWMRFSSLGEPKV